MRNLFLIDGASGTGKSDLLLYVESYSTKVAIVRKATTREKREYEKQDCFLDLDFVDKNEFDKKCFDYSYTYSRERYGFNKIDIEHAFSRATNVFVIVRNHDVIRQLSSDFKFINVVSVYIYTDPVTVRDRLERQNMSEKQIQFRLDRFSVAFEDYLRHSSAYNEVLINNSSPKDYHQVIDAMIEKYSARPDIQDNLVFVLMSFNAGLKDFSDAIKRAVTDHDPNLECINLDDLTGSFKISQEAKKHITRCRLAIVDLTENKPNVYYELGFAHASGKEVIITAHENSPLMFYPAEYKTVRYSGVVDLYDKLRRELEGQLPKRGQRTKKPSRKTHK